MITRRTLSVAAVLASAVASIATSQAPWEHYTSAEAVPVDLSTEAPVAVYEIVIDTRYSTGVIDDLDLSVWMSLSADTLDLPVANECGLDDSEDSEVSADCVISVREDESPSPFRVLATLTPADEFVDANVTEANVRPQGSTSWIDGYFTPERGEQIFYLTLELDTEIEGAWVGGEVGADISLYSYAENSPMDIEASASITLVD